MGRDVLRYSYSHDSDLAWPNSKFHYKPCPPLPSSNHVNLYRYCSRRHEHHLAGWRHCRNHRSYRNGNLLFPYLYSAGCLYYFNDCYQYQHRMRGHCTANNHLVQHRIQCERDARCRMCAINNNFFYQPQQHGACPAYHRRNTLSIWCVFLYLEFW